MRKELILKKIISLLVVLAIFCSLFCVGSLAAESGLSAVVTIGEKTQNVLPSGNIFYLPASVDIKNVKLSTGQMLDLSGAKTTDARGAECYVLSVDGTKYTFYHGGVASLFVGTSNWLSYIEQSKNNRDKKAKIAIVNEKGEVEYCDTEETSSEIKGRGNATWSYYKKPYQIKLSSKKEILGMDKAKTWILLANYTDQSALHNALAFKLGEDLSVPYNIEYNFVDLYIDGSYRGLYMICEKVQIDGNRIDISELEKDNEAANPNVDFAALSQKTVTSGTLIKNSIITSYTYTVGVKSPEDITGGYIVELDNIRGSSEPSRFTTENGNTYVVKSPEFASKEEMEYIARLFADMEEAAYSETGYNKKGKHYSEYIDIESFAAVYTVQELLKNWDAYLSSMFFFKDKNVGSTTSKIFCGPIWDMDNTLGNINFNKEFGTDTAYLWAQHGVFQSYHRGLASPLMKHDDFAAAVAKIYETAHAKVKEYLLPGGWFEESVNEIYSSVMMDRTRWKLYDTNSWLLSAGGYKTSVKFVQFEKYGTAQDTSQETALGFMRYYLSSRSSSLLDSIGKAPIEEKPSDNTTVLPVTTQSTAATDSAQTTTVQTTPSTSQTLETSVSEPSSGDVAEPFAYGAVIWVCAGVIAIGACVGILIFIKKKR